MTDTTNPWDMDDAARIEAENAAKIHANEFEATMQGFAKAVTKRLAEERRRAVFKGVLKLTFAVAMTPVFMLWHGYALKTIWNLFGAPLFHVSMSIYFAAGLSLFVRMILPQNLTVKNPDGFVANVTFNLLTPIGPLLLALAWHWLGWGL